MKQQDAGIESGDFEAEEQNQEPWPRGPLSPFPAGRHIAPALCMLVLFYIASSAQGNYSFAECLWLSGDKIFRSHEYWRLVTSLFVHGDFLHLISNAFLFVIFGWMLKAYFGYWIFPVLSVLTGCAANFITVMFYEPHIRLVGSSGMIHGMMALWITFYIRFDTDRSRPLRIMRAAGFVLAMIIPNTVDPHVSYLAHFAGFLTGLVCGICLIPVIKVKNPR